MKSKFVFAAKSAIFVTILTVFCSISAQAGRQVEG